MTEPVPTPESAAFRLAERPDLEALTAAFARDGRVRVPGVLADDGAERLRETLLTQVPWHLFFNDGPQLALLDGAQMQALGPQGQQQLLAGVLERARGQMQFLYSSFPYVAAMRAGQPVPPLLAAAFAFLNSPAVLDLVRRISGDPAIRHADSQAALYAPGHFLTRHGDGNGPGEDRRVAYVLNLSRDWRADWGGQLQFLSEAGEVTGAWVPGFNLLGLFRVPTPHLVTQVSAFAGGPRLSLTGWFRAD